VENTPHRRGKTLKNEINGGPAVSHMPTPRGCAVLKFPQAASTHRA
jgi:hypothetical protein